MTINLNKILEILVWQLAQKAAVPSFMDDETKKACEELKLAIVEGRVQITPKVK